MAQTAAQKRAQLTKQAADLAAKTKADIAAAEATLPPAPTATARSLGMRTDAEIDAGITPTPIAPITYATEQYLPEPSDTEIATAETAVAQAATDYAVATGSSGGAGGSGGGLTTDQVTAMINDAVAKALAGTKTTQQLQLANAENEAIATLSAYGLTGAIGSGVVALMQSGLDMNSILSIINAPDPSKAINNLGLSGNALSAAQGLVTSWQDRFSGNQLRIKQGLAPLDPAAYLQYEQTYKQLLSASGVANTSPLMDNSYIGQLIGSDVKLTEMQRRVDAATTALTNEDPYVLAQLQSQFGLTKSSIMSHLLDPNTSAAVVAQEVNAAQIGGAAARTGAGLAFGPGTGVDQGDLTAMQLAGQGITAGQAATGFANIAVQQPSLQSISNIYGQGLINPNQIGQALQASTFGTTVGGMTQAQAQQELERLKTQQVSAFSGSSGAGKGSLGTAGQEAAGGIS